MGDVIPLLGSARPYPMGTIHVWMHARDDFEIGHESSSGNSWGWFEQFSSAAEAVTAAHALNARELSGKADVYIPDDVRALLAGGAT